MPQTAGDDELDLAVQADVLERRTGLADGRPGSGSRCVPGAVRAMRLVPPSMPSTTTTSAPALAASRTLVEDA